MAFCLLYYLFNRIFLFVTPMDKDNYLSQKPDRSYLNPNDHKKYSQQKYGAVTDREIHEELLHENV